MCIRDSPNDPRTAYNEPAYASLSRDQIPLTESLKDTVARVKILWNESIAPEIRKGKRILVAAHGNSLRALIKELDNISDKDIALLNIPTGQPLVYELDDDLRPVRQDVYKRQVKRQNQYRVFRIQRQFATIFISGNRSGQIRKSQMCRKKRRLDVYKRQRFRQP